jgi:uncharacterized membrane protein
MTNLWAISYADPSRASQARDRIFELQEDKLLSIKDMVVAWRQPDGAFQLDQEVCSGGSLETGSALGFIVGVLMAAAAGSPALAALGIAGGPLAGALLGGTVSIFTEAKIDPDFVRQVEQGMKPGNSVLFLLDRARGLDRLLPRLHGLGGEVLRTSVDLERSRQIQAALLCPPDSTPSPETRS